MERYGETHAAATLPVQCPYTFQQMLGAWLPENASGNAD
jgi:hypothetical protein